MNALVELARRHVLEEFVQLLLRRERLRGIPVDVYELAARYGVKFIDRVDIAQSGRLIGGECGFAILLNAADSEERQRFTVAHEVGHIIVGRVKRGELWSAPGDTGLRSRLVWAMQSVEIERICNAFAAEVLMPADAFREQASFQSMCWRTIEEVARTFAVSFGATMWRLPQANLPYCAIRWDQRRAVPNGGLVPGSYCTAIDEKLGELGRPRRDQVVSDPSSLIYKSYETGRPHEGWQTLSLSRSQRESPYYVHNVASRAKRCVTSLVALSDTAEPCAARRNRPDTASALKALGT